MEPKKAYSKNGVLTILACNWQRSTNIPKQAEELARGNARAAMFDLSKQLISKGMSDARKLK